MRRYRLSGRAKRDLDQIWSGLAQKATVDVADKVIDEITSRFPLLAMMPESGRVRADIAFGVRSFPVDQYVIYYQKPSRGLLVVSRVLHGKRDQIDIYRKG
jgi:toxin ParE1/3/4